MKQPATTTRAGVEPGPLPPGHVTGGPARPAVGSEGVVDLARALGKVWE